MCKQQVRLQIKQEKSILLDEQKNVSSMAVFSRIEQTDMFKNASNIMLYHSLPDELPTHKVVERWSRSKNIYLPRVNNDKLDVVAYKPQSMEPGSFNIVEPQGEAVDVNDMDLIIVPAIAYDAKGNRIGRGKGYYDRLLADCNVVKVGVGYDFQLLDEIPSELHDIKMNYIVTPDNIIEI